MTELNAIKKHILAVLPQGDILFIVPPFVNARTPIIGPHILQTVARKLGFKTDILYVNLLLASIIGNDLYESISFGQPFRMLGERLFARSAHGLPRLGKSPELCLNPVKSVFGNERSHPMTDFEYKYYDNSAFDLNAFFKIEEICYALTQAVTQTIASLDYKMIGCSTNWEQNNCCIALINEIKKIQPDSITLIGGSNCEDEMAEGIASLSSSVDYIFSGESEQIFADFLERYAAGNLPSQRIIEAHPVEDLDAIPLPDYTDYFTQLHCFFMHNPPKEIVIGYETSRGCWWGKCSFCGQNGKRVRFRQKAVTKVVRELEQINVRHPQNRILLIDKVLPVTFNNELLPSLCEKEGASPISCEHRPDLKLSELMRLKKARFNIIKFGIEALSTGLLKLMNKGVTASQNLLLLRNARSLGIIVDWNMLWGFPGDQSGYYEETLKLLPLIHHLSPPAVFRHLCLDRFSMYFKQPADYEIKGLRPWSVYKTVYLDRADIHKLAYRFIGDYPCGAHEHPEVIREITAGIELWRESWKKSALVMTVFADYFAIYDSRNCTGKENNHILDASQAKAIMTYSPYSDTEYQKWAVEAKLGVIADSWYVPLITASPQLLLQFEG